VLRPYQCEPVDALCSYWQKGGVNGFIVIPTGGGKSLVLTQLVDELHENYPWADFGIVAHGDGLVGFVAHPVHISRRNAARGGGPLRDNVIASVWLGARRRRGEGRTLFHGESRSATGPDGDDRSAATISANTRLRIHEKAGTDVACGSCGRPIRISVQAEGRHQ
jgi:hypothetical protein